MRGGPYLILLACLSVRFAAAQSIVTTFPWSTTFDEQPFTLMNGTETNQWRYGTIVDSMGTSLYIGSDLTEGNDYWMTGDAWSANPANSSVYAYVDLAIPEGDFNINLSFDVRVGGAQNWDGLKVFIVPDSYFPTGGTYIPYNPAYHSLDEMLCGIPQWQTKHYQLSPSYAGDTVRLVFWWRNGYLTGSQPGAAVDNLSITADPCISPFFTQVSAITSSSALATWPEVPASGGYTYELRTQGNPASGPLGLAASGDLEADSLQLDGLQPGTFFNLYLRSECTTEWSPGVPFVTDPQCGSAFYDPGGPLGAYSPSTDRTYVICPSEAGSAVHVQFNTLNLHGGDRIVVFDGAVAGGEPKLVLDMDSDPQTIVSNNYDGCLTLHFTSDAQFQSLGWTAQVDCAPYPNCAIWGEQAEEVAPDSVHLRWHCTGSYGPFVVEHTLPGHSFGNGELAGPDGEIQIVAEPDVWLEEVTPGAVYDVQVRTSCTPQEEFGSLGVRVRIQVPPDCGWPFTDRGGPNEAYPPYAFDRHTICPDSPSQSTILTFTSFEVEPWYDALYIFNGPDTMADLISSGLPAPLSTTTNLGAGGWWGTSPPVMPFASTDPSGCLTVVFTSDETGELDGWVADVQCGHVGVPEQVVLAKGLRCYPLPVETGGELHITGLPINKGGLHTRIMDAMGHIVARPGLIVDLYGRASLQVPSLSSGVYSIEILDSPLLLARFVVR